MMPVRQFLPSGTEAFRYWMESSTPGDTPTNLISDDTQTQSYGAFVIDPSKKFESRFEFGEYLHNVFSTVPETTLLAQNADGMWAWVCAVYFSQLTALGIRRPEHYIPIRKGTFGSLLHRNAARTAFELVYIHGANARVALQQGMHTHGQLLESLSAKQTTVHNRGFFVAATKMYLGSNGRLSKGAATKPKDRKKRRPGETTGMGSIRRLPMALERLWLTYDVDQLSADQLIAVLPREFSKWKSKA